MRQLILIGAGVPAGLAVGLLAWLVAGGTSSANVRLTPLEGRLAESRAPARADVPRRMATAPELLARPLFALTVGPGAVREPLVVVQGLSVSSGRLAALLDIDGQGPAWISVGESRGGVSLQAVSRTGALIETIVGVREIALGGAAGAPLPAAAPVSAQAAPAAAVIDQIPPGFRSPPPPASAPRAGL